MTTDDAFETLGSHPVADLSFLNVTMRDVRTPGGEVVERVVIEHPGAVGVVPIDGDDIYLIEQYRAPVDRTVLEIPAGKLDHDGESLELTANRELEEEIGQRAGTLTPLTSLWTTVGFCDEEIHLFVGRDLRPGRRNPVGHEEHASRIVKMPFAEAVDLVVSGGIKDAKTMVGILLAARHGSA